MFVDSCIGVWLSYETTATVMSHSAGQGGAADHCNDQNYSSPPWTLEQSPARDTQQTLDIVMLYIPRSVTVTIQRR